MSGDEEQATRLREMFPTAPPTILNQMTRLYQGREGLMKAALISLGYRRASNYNVEQSVEQSPIALMMLKPSSKKMFEKLVNYFPDKDETLIKDLMYEHKEVEHEIISLLVESGGHNNQFELTNAKSYRSEGATSRQNKNGAIMKLRYLKFLFPTCEEIELYHLLHCNDLNAQRVIEEIEKRGHKKINIDEKIQNRKSQTQQMRAQSAALTAKGKLPVSDPLEAHLKRTKPIVNEARANNLRENLKKIFPEQEENLIRNALEAADYNESLARKFLTELKPIDESKYKQTYNWRYAEPDPELVLYPCKGIQKGDTSFMSITGTREFVAIPKEMVECSTALALLKVDASTFTQEDFLPVERCSQAKGSQRVHLATGSIFKELEVKKSPRIGSDKKRQIGSCYTQVCADISRPKPNALASGRDHQLAKGRDRALRCGHNEKLVQRTHPFFLADTS